MTLCGEADMQQLLGRMSAGGGDALADAERLIAAHPDDPRLHFLRGSILAGTGRAIEAHAALSRAVALAPDYAIARFQLGFFELTSGEADRALATWAPLDTSPATPAYLRDFVAGLRHLAADRFAEAVAALHRGIAANADNPPLNDDMRLIIARCDELAPPPEAPAAAETSATSFFLDQFGDTGVRH